MKRIIITCFTLILWALHVFADISDHGRPWDADDNYDSSRGLWFVLFIIVIGIVVFIGAAAKHAWDNYKNSIKDGLGIVAFFGGCILLFLGGKACSEQHPHDNGNAINVHQQYNSTPQTPSKSQQPQQQPHTEYYYETCTYCNAKGYVRCSHCNGAGVIPIRCLYCKGTGKVERELMTGFYIEDMCPACQGRGNELTDCEYCSPRFIPYFQCTVNGYTNCPQCNGTGQVQRSRIVYY